MKKSFCLTAVLLILALVRVFGQCDTIAVFPFTETFEDISPSRACWTQQQVIGNNIWTFTDGSISGPPALAYEGDINACFTDDGNGEVTKLISPVFDLSAYSSSCILTFYYAQGNWFGDQNILKVYYRTSSVNPWVLIFTDNTNRPAWVYKTLPLPSPSASYQIAFEGIDNYGYANVVDLVSILPPCAAVDSFPFTETFENNSPTRYCWTQEAVANNKTWGFESGALMGNVDTAHSGAFNAYFSSDWTLNCVTRLISPVFNLSGASMPYQLSFYYAQEENNGSQNYLNVYYRSSPASGWLLLFSDSTNRPDWTLANVTLPNPSPFYQLAFEGIANYGFPNVIDKVMISGCSIPQMIQLTNITTDSATVQWMSGGFEYQWDLKIAEAGFDPDTEGILHPGIMMTSHQLTNLSQGTRYDVYLRPVCNPADTNPWIGPYRFNTLYTIPYFENFDSAGNYPTAPGWQSIAYSTYANHNPKVLKTGQAYSEPYCININDCIMPVKKAPTLQNQSEEDFLITPEVEEVILISPEMIVSLDQLRVSFYAISDGDPTYCGLCSLSIGTMSDPTDYNTFTAYQLIPLSDMWQYYIVNLNNYSGTNAYVGFKLVLSDLASGSALIDNILFSYLPSCFEPSDLQVDTATENEITIKWVPGQNEMQWDVQYGPQGFTQGTLVQGLTDSTFTAANLQASSTFDFYVRADCQNDDLSAWTGPLTVNTLCGPMTAPILQNFDNTATASLPNCWSAIMSGYSIVQVQENSYTSAPNSLMIYNDASLQDTVFFVTPAITNALNTLMISFQSMSYNWGNILTLGTMSDPTDPTTFTAVYDLIQIPEFTAWSWDFGEYSGTDQYIAFRLIDDEVILLDDIVIESTILCEMPASLTVEQITQTSVTISWLALNAESSWDILYGEAGFDPQAGGVFLEGITANPYVVSNLNPGISYDFYVWALCGNGEYSNRSGPLVATTSCESQNLPWYENFESTPSGTLPPCILTADDNQDGQTWTTAYDNNDNAAIVLLPAVGDQFQDDWFFSPPFPLLAGHSYTISFDYMGFPANPNNYITVYNGTSATVLAMGDTSIYGTAVPLDTYSTASFQFIPAADGINVFGWNCVSGFPQSTLFIDNISISETVQISCPQSIFACTAGPPILLTGATPLGGVYSGVNVYQNQTMDYVFDPATLSAGQYVVTYTYSTSFTSSSCDFIILVSDLPVVTCPAAINIAPGDAPFLLTGGNPEGGNFYGQAVVNNMFNPGMANMGPNSILYMYTDPVSLCQGSCSFVVTMNEVVNLSCPPDFNICVTASPIVLSGASPAGGVYSGSGVYLNQTLEYVFDPALVIPGNYTITYTYTTQNGIYACTFVATVNDLPSITCPADIDYCWGNPAFVLTGSAPAGGTYSGSGITGNTFDPNVAGLGSHVITYTYTNANACTSLCEFSIHVIEGQLMSVIVQADTLSACLGEVITVEAMPLNAGSNPLIQWYINNQLQANTNAILQLPFQVNSSVYCVVSSSAPCTLGNPATSNTLSVNILPNLFPSLIISADDDTVCEGSMVTYHVVSVADTGNSPIFQWQVNGINTGGNSQTYTYLPGNADLVKCLLFVNEPCVSQSPANSNSISTIIIPTPLVLLNLAVDTMCINWDPIILTGGTPLGGTYSGPGVSNQEFDPVLAGSGNHQIGYSYMDSWGCQNTVYASVLVDVCTGLPMNPELNPLLLYPNPANDILVIRTGSLDVNPGTILITDLPGRQQKCAIVEHDNTGLVLDISGLKPGLYTIRLDQEFRKFLIVR